MQDTKANYFSCGQLVELGFKITVGDFLEDRDLCSSTS